MVVGQEARDDERPVAEHELQIIPDNRCASLECPCSNASCFLLITHVCALSGQSAWEGQPLFSDVFSEMASTEERRMA